MVMAEIPLEDATTLIFPRLTVLVTSIDSVGNRNAAPYSWIMPISFNPPMLILGIRAKETHTIKNIRQTKEFVVNVVTKDWARKAVECEAKGIDDKIEAAGLETVESEKVKPPAVKNAKIVLECKLNEIFHPSSADHYVVVGEIVAARKDKSVKNQEIVMHLLGEKFILPGKEIRVRRYR